MNFCDHATENFIFVSRFYERKRIKANFKSSYRRCSIKNVVLTKFCNIHRKAPVFESLFNKVAGFQACFPVNIAKFLGTPILKNICKPLLQQFVTKFVRIIITITFI